MMGRQLGKDIGGLWVCDATDPYWLDFTELEEYLEKKTMTKNHNCQYNKPGCQKIATYQHILKLSSVKLDKGYICGNCKEYLERQKNQ